MGKRLPLELRADQAAELLGVSPGTLANWRSHGYGPPFLKVGGFVVYERARVRKWMRGQVCPCCKQRMTYRPRMRLAAKGGAS